MQFFCYLLLILIVAFGQLQSASYAQQGDAILNIFIANSSSSDEDGSSSMLLTEREYTTTPLYKVPPCRAPTILHGVIVHRGVEIEGEKLVQPGAIVTLNCEDGFIPKGETRSACVEIGWEPQIGFCIPMSDDYSECGFRSTFFKQNYVESATNEVSPGEFPWMAKMEVEFQAHYGTSVCGATLIARGWMLTVAHCINRAPVNGIALSLSDGTNLNVYIEPEERLRNRNKSINSISVIYHPFYEERNGTYYYDFALIRLSQIARLNDRVRVICLPDTPIDMCKSANDLTRGVNRDNCKEFYSAGWGTTETAVPLTFSTARKVPSVLIKPEVCKVPLNMSESANFCAKSTKANFCFASPGVSLMCAKSNRFYLAGVFSYNPSHKCGRGVGDEPDIYGRVCEIMYWIRLTMGDILPTTTTAARPTRSRTTKQVSLSVSPVPKSKKTSFQNETGPQHFSPNLGEAAASGDLPQLLQLLDEGADPNAIGYPTSFYPDYCNWTWHWPNATALIWAAGCNRSSDILSALIEKGANVDYRDFYGMSALVASALHGNTRNVRLLLDHGANINIKNNAGDTALIEASFFGFMDTVRLLIERGADIGAKTSIGSTALIEAASNNRTETVRFLLDNGAYSNDMTMDGKTALMEAAGGGFITIVQLLIENAADLEVKEKINSWTALIFAARNDKNETIQYLRDHGAKLTGCDHELCKVCRFC